MNAFVRLEASLRIGFIGGRPVVDLERTFPIAGFSKQAWHWFPLGTRLRL